MLEIMVLDEIWELTRFCHGGGVHSQGGVYERQGEDHRRGRRDKLAPTRLGDSEGVGGIRRLFKDADFPTSIPY